MTRLLTRPLLLAAAGIAVASLSVHVFMLQVLGVPYPDLQGVGASGLVLVAVRMFALFVVVRLAPAAFLALPIAARIGLVALLDTMLAGNIRSALMEGVVTEGLVAPALGLLAQLTTSLILAMILVVSRSLTRRLPVLTVVALATTAFMSLIVAPFISAIEEPFAHLARPEIHTPPYGVAVLSWSYATFLETVSATLAVAWATSGALSRKPLVAALQFVVLVLALRGTLVMQLLFPWLMQTGFAASALSTSQFFLQDLVMASLTWWIWRPSLPGREEVDPQTARRPHRVAD